MSKIIDGTPAVNRQPGFRRGTRRAERQNEAKKREQKGRQEQDKTQTLISNKNEARGTKRR